MIQCVSLHTATKQKNSVNPVPVAVIGGGVAAAAILAFVIAVGILIYLHEMQVLEIPCQLG